MIESLFDCPIYCNIFNILTLQRQFTINESNYDHVWPQRDRAIHRTAAICIRINTKRVKPPPGWLLNTANCLGFQFERSISETKTLTEVSEERKQA